jgi:hypothetical protein
MSMPPMPTAKYCMCAPERGSNRGVCDELPRTPDLSELEMARRDEKLVYRAAAGGSDTLTLQSPLLIG